jgi:quercetin dioxygenase-like cupin family protein
LSDRAVVRTFEAPDDIRSMEKGSFKVVSLGGLTIGRASYEPGWRWSEHVGRGTGEALCSVEHVGMVVSGRNLITMADGSTFEVGPGDLFHVPPGHDSEVIGDEPYVSLHFLGADSYARGR